MMTHLLTPFLCAAMLTTDVPRYADVPRVHTGSPIVFAELLERAESETVRIMVFGDSQETCPGGAGTSYIPNINVAFFERMGNCPETPLAHHVSIGGDPTTSPAGWLWRGGGSPSAGTATRISSQELPPAFSDDHLAARKHLGPTSQRYGWLFRLDPEASTVADQTIANGTEYFRRDGGVVADVLVKWHSETGDVGWRSRVASDAPAYGSAVSGAGVVHAGLAEPDLNQEPFVFDATPPLHFAGFPMLALEVQGTEPQFGTDVVGVRFRNLTHTNGVVVQSFSTGGYQARDPLWFSRHMEPVLRALEPDCVVLQYGANDAFGGNRSAHAFGNDLRAFITYLRVALSDPELPIIIASDTFRTGGTPEQREAFDRYPGAALLIAQEDPHVLAVNLRRIAEEDFQWGGDQQEHLTDGVHLTIEGQRHLARMLVQELFNAFGNECADATHDGICDAADLLAVLAAYGTDHQSADVNGDGVVDIADLLYVLSHWGACPKATPDLQ